MKNTDKRTRLGRWETPPGWTVADGCTILGCGRTGIARGMCWNHYQRARRGLPVYVFLKRTDRRNTEIAFGPPRPKRAVLRMASLTWLVAHNWTPDPNLGCWLWLGDYYPSGYGKLGTFRDPWGGYVHRAVLYFNGERLEAGRSKHVRHLCNNPACVNPAHLRYGTAAENMADRTLRYRLGELKHDWAKRGPRKLSPSLVAYCAEARARGVTFRELGDDLGVQNVTVARAVRWFNAQPRTQEAA